MSKLRSSVLGFLQEIGDRSGCHQLPERSFQIKDYVFPVCARCTGVFIGQLFSIITMLAGLRLPPASAVVLLLVMGLDWFIQYIGIKESNNIRRFVTGIMGGFGLFHIYYHIIIMAIKMLTVVMK